MNDEVAMMSPFGKEAPIGIIDEIDIGEAAQGGPSRRRIAASRQILYLDLSDLMEYARHNGTLSGI